MLRLSFKSFFGFTAAMFCFAAHSAFGLIAIDTKPASPLFVSDPGEVSATLSKSDDVKSVELWFYKVGTDSNVTNGNHVALSGSSATYGGSFPFLPVGSYNWWIQAEYKDGTVDTSAVETTEITSTYIDKNAAGTTIYASYTDALSYDRWHDNRFQSTLFNNATYLKNTYGWTQDGGTMSSNMYANTPNGGQWKASGIAWAYSDNWANHKPKLTTGTTATGMTDSGNNIKYPILYFMNLGSESESSDPNPFIRSPRLYGGVGAISFGLINIEGSSNKIVIEKSTVKEGEPVESNWVYVKSYDLTQGQKGIITVVIEDPDATFVRIKRTKKRMGYSLTGGRIVIDNIKISRPAADVVMEEKLHNPGYPSVNTPTIVRCAVKSKDNFTPAYDRNVSVFYKYASTNQISITSGWSTTNMVLEKVDGQYEIYRGEIPASASTRTGYMHYYFECKFDGHYVQSEQIIGKEYFSNGTTSVNPPGNEDKTHCNYELRPFKSRYEGVRLQYDKGDGSIEFYDMTLVGDNEWQITAPVGANVSSKAYFTGRNCYFDGAEKYDAFSYFYGDNDQPEPYETPNSGQPERFYNSTDDLLPIVVNSSSSGYLLYRLTDSVKDSELSYMIKRGLYQDFNTWAAEEAYYNKGISGTGISEYTTGFEDWTEPYDWSFGNTSWTPGDAPLEDFTQESPTNSFINRNTFADWAYLNSMPSSDRVTNSAAHNPLHTEMIQSNMVLRISANGGRFRNTAISSYAMPNGIGTVSARLRSAIDDNHFTICNNYYKPGTDKNSTVKVKVAFKIPQSVRPKSKYYFSIVFCYQNENNYYEMRFVHTDTSGNNNTSDNTYAMELWRTLNGVQTKVQTNAQTDSKLNSDIVYEMLLEYHKEGNNNRIDTYVTLKDQSNNSVIRWNGSSLNNEPSVTGNALPDGGKVGCAAYDCVPEIRSLEITGGDASNTALSIANGKFGEKINDSNWSFGGTDNTYSTSQATYYRWYVTAGGYLTRRIPRNVVNLSVAPVQDNNEAPSEDNKYTFVGSVTLDTLQEKTYSWDINSATNLFVDFRVGGRPGDTAEGYIVLDDARITPWRGYSRNSELRSAVVEDVNSYKWTTTAQQEDFWKNSDGWKILEGFVVTNNAASGNPMSRFNISQAYPGLVQGLVSPPLTNGVGLVKFNYQVSSALPDKSDVAQDAKIVYVVEYSSDGNDSVFNEPSAVYTNYLNNSGFRSCEIAENFGVGKTVRARIRIIPEESSPDLYLWVDEPYVNTSPPQTDNMWMVYNGRITSVQNDAQGNSLIFEGKSLFLNNTATNNIPPRSAVNGFDESEPYLQSPKMGEGIGEIAFMYRTYDTLKPGYISIALAADKNHTQEHCELINNKKKNARNGACIKFENPKIYYKNFNYMRIFSSTNSACGRVCIDNVLVTEPSRPSFDISAVLLDPEQPVVSSTNVTIKAKISRKMQNPKGIRLFVTYNVGTNNWGYTNWWGRTAPFTSPNTFELHRIGETSEYTPTDGVGLPSMPADGVIQYVVWGIHDDMDGKYDLENMIFQRDDSFKNPTWYGSLNYNETYKDQGFSPYYIIYSCPPGSVWINEIYIQRSGSEDFWRLDDGTYVSGSGCYEFLELAGKAGTDISGWRITATRDEDGSDLVTYTIPPNTKIKNMDNGWGYYVIGEADMLSVVMPWANTSFVTNITEKLVDEQDLWTDGGAEGTWELSRENGIIEQRYYYKGSRSDKLYGVKTPPYEYIGSKGSTSKYRGYSFSLVDDISDDDKAQSAVKNIEGVYTNKLAGSNGGSKVWYWTAGVPTPGKANKGFTAASIAQTFTPLSPSTAYKLISMIDTATYGGANGTQNGVVTEITITVGEGSTDTPRIVYVAGDWYKIVSLTSGGTTISDAVGKKEYTFDGSAITADTQNIVTFGPTTEADYTDSPEASRWSTQILDWFRLNGWTESDIERGDGDGFSVQQEYLLNTSPILTTTVENKTSAITVTDTGVSMELYLLRTDSGADGVTEVTTPVNGKVVVYGAADLTETVWTQVQESEIPAKTAFSGRQNETVTFGTNDLDLRFFKWNVE